MLRIPLLAVCAFASQAAGADDMPPAIYIVGQDLDAIRGYYAADCCARADGTTAYVNLYGILDPDGNYGGLGIDKRGDPVASEQGWGAGPISAYKTANEFGVDHLAIGLWIAENNNPRGLSQIANGDFNAEIDQLGRFIRGTDATVYLRIGYEFDGAWNEGFQHPSIYVAAWRAIVDRLRKKGTDNVRFVWQSSTSVIDEVIDGRRENIEEWYPGDDYVDWAGLSWFTLANEKASVDGAPDHASLAELATELVEFARSRGKPVMIAEATPQGYDLLNNTRSNISRIYDGAAAGDTRNVSNDEIWNDWYAPLFEFMDANSDTVRALAYINSHWDAQAMWGPPYDGGYWGDTRVEVNEDIAARFTEAVDAWRASVNE